MEYVEAFSQLVKARFEDRLSIEMEVEKGLSCMVPCLIVQPIVENAVIHGAMSRKQGFVKIEVFERDEQVIIEVKDNGKGIPENILRDLRNDISDDSSTGLFNVDKRLRYIYGEDNGLDIFSTSYGTTIRIKIENRRLISKAV